MPQTIDIVKEQANDPELIKLKDKLRAGKANKAEEKQVYRNEGWDPILFVQWGYR